MLTAALEYARRGIPVLPLHCPSVADPTRCSCRRLDCDRTGKHPRLRHGLTEASIDPHLVAAWWTRWPEANIGLRTGVVMDVADLDSEQGRDGLLHLLGGELPPGPVARTGSGGWHVWFAPSGYGNRVRLLPGVDWRGAGGYVVAPPSRHASGQPYRWLSGPSADLPQCPPALDQLLAGPPGPSPATEHIRHPGRYAEAALDAAAQRTAYAVVGTRNDTLNRAAFALGRLVGAGLLDESTVRRELAAAARHAGLGRAETLRTIRSGLTAGRRHPLAAPSAA